MLELEVEQEVLCFGFAADATVFGAANGFLCSTLLIVLLLLRLVVHTKLNND